MEDKKSSNTTPKKRKRRKAFNNRITATIPQITRLLFKNNGNLSRVATILKVVPQTLRKKIRENETLRQALEESIESGLDKAEYSMDLLIEGVPEYLKDDAGNYVLDEFGQKIFDGWKVEPKSDMIKYKLSTKGKNRGYQKTTEVSGPGGKPLLEGAFKDVKTDALKSLIKEITDLKNGDSEE